MLGFEHFYWGTTKKIIVAVGSIFDNLVIAGDHGDDIPVPLYYSPREKFIDNRAQNPDIDSTAFDIIFPAIGFELTGLNYAAERALNPLQKIHDASIENDTSVTYNRAPYDLTFQVTIGARRFEESLRIVEQILPFFQPDIALTINDREDFELQTNINVALNSVGLDMQYEGSFDQRRTILWNLQLTAKAYYYAPLQQRERIKKTVLDMRQLDFDRRFEAYESVISPRSAKKSETHVVIDTIIEGP